MRYALVITLLSLGAVTNLCAQREAVKDVELTFGNMYSSFQFRNSAGDREGGYGYAALNSFGVNLNLRSGRHVLRPCLGLRQGGAKTTIENTPVDWKLNYFDLSMGYLYKILHTDNLEISPGIALYGGYLLNGEQNIGENSRLLMKDTGAIKSFDFGMQGIVNSRFQINDQLGFTLEYRFGYGMAQIENDLEPQTANNLYHAVILGIGFRLN